MKTEPKNIEAFQKLVERYETITIEEIKEIREEYPAEILTGFGSRATCSLCLSVNEDCSKCVYGKNKESEINYNCVVGNNSKSYERIEEANTPHKLFNAFRNRAKHLRKTYPQYLK